MVLGERAASSLTPDEVADAIEALPETAWIRLRKVAHVYSRGRPLDPDDLLSKAFIGALEGERHCPRGVDLVRFLSGAIRSIASDSIKAQKRRAELHLVTQADEGGALPFDPEDERPNAEEALADHEECARIRGAILSTFADDVVAQILVEGIMEGIDGEELRALTDLDRTAFASKRRNIRRCLDRVFPEGWKS
jgi:DNA-directed RNA polymerase specialized sigma24 family protein